MNIYNNLVKGTLLLEKNAHYFVFESDGLKIPVNINNKFFYWLINNNINIDYPRVYQGQLRTRKEPNLEINQLINIDLSDTMIAPETFKVEGQVFGVYKNCITKYNADYNFLMIYVGHEPSRFPLKICYSQLANYNIKDRRIEFIVKRIGEFLVLQSYTPVDTDDNITYGVING